MATHFTRKLLEVTQPLPSYACHRIGQADAVTVQLPPQGPRMYLPNPRYTALLNSLSDTALYKLETRFETFAANMDSSGSSQHFPTLEDFLTAVPGLLQQHAEATAQLWPLDVTVEPITEQHRGYSSLAAALQLPQLVCVRASKDFAAGDAIGPYCSLLMPTDMHEVLYQTVEESRLVRHPVCLAVGSQRITFDASCCCEGDHNKLANVLDYRCITPAGVHNPKRDMPGGANAAFLGYVDRHGRPWLFVVALKDIAAAEEICVEYNREGLRTNLHYQNIGRKQLISQLTPNIQRLYAAMQEVQTALAPKLTEDKAPKAAQQQQNQQQSQQQQQRRKVKPGQLVLNSNDELAITASKKRSNAYARTVAANVLKQLAGTNPILKEAVVAAGGVRALAHLLCAGTDAETGTAAAAALGCIAAGSSVHKKTIAAMPSAINGLVGLLHSGETAAVEAATGTLRSLSSADAGRRAIGADSDALSLLAYVLSTGSKAAKQSAAAALANLTVESKANQRAVAAAPGAVSCLAQMLASDDEASQAAAAAALSNLSTMTSIKHQIGATPGATPGLVKLLMSQSREVQHSAATALSNLAAGSPANKTSILSCNDALVGLSLLLDSSDEAVQRAAATALCNLSSAIIASKCWYMDLVAAGGLAALQSLAGSEDGKGCKWAKGNAEVQAAAAAALRRLCKVGKISFVPSVAV
ncbi:hypothetical protein OEZ86_008326 [Tetradesmus obliquus]|nr:hypothetical protein OEZ86_008326 [Tetradesmus obliquus]